MVALLELAKRGRILIAQAEAFTSFLIRRRAPEPEPEIAPRAGDAATARPELESPAVPAAEEPTP